MWTLRGKGPKGIEVAYGVQFRRSPWATVDRCFLHSNTVRPTYLRGVLIEGGAHKPLYSRGFIGHLFTVLLHSWYTTLVPRTASGDRFDHPVMSAARGHRCVTRLQSLLEQQSCVYKYFDWHKTGFNTNRNLLRGVCFYRFREMSQKCLLLTLT